MTGFFSTAEESTSMMGVSAVVIAWAPALVVIAPLMLAAGGGSAASAATLSMVANLSTKPGATVNINGAMTANSSLAGHGGALVEIEPVGFTFTFESIAVNVGASVPFVSDVKVYDFESTAKFSTALQSDGFYVLRLQHSMELTSLMSAEAGARLLIDGQMQVAYSAFDPVVRPRKVRTQMIVS